MCPNCGAVASPPAGPQGSYPGDPPGGYRPGPAGYPGYPPPPPPGGYPGYPPPPPPGGYPGYPPAAPGGYRGYPPSGPMPAKSYNLDGLANALAVMLTISALISLIGALFGVILISTFLLLPPTAIVFLIWFYRARQNAGAPGLAAAPVTGLVNLRLARTDLLAVVPVPDHARYLAGRAAGTYSLDFGGTQLSLAFAAIAAVLLALIVKRVSDGLVGRVGKLSSAAPWQPGAPAQ